MRALEFLNVLLADVPGGVGPFLAIYLAIYLAASYHWNPRDIGIAISVSGFAGVITQTPAGELVDRLQQKRLLIVITSMFIAVSSLVMVMWTTMTLRHHDGSEARRPRRQFARRSLVNCLRAFYSPQHWADTLHVCVRSPIIISVQFPIAKTFQEGITLAKAWEIVHFFMNRDGNIH